MATIRKNLEKLQDTKEDTKAAINERGVKVTNESLDKYYLKIKDIGKIQGLQWTIQEYSFDNNWREVCYSEYKGLFVAVGNVGGDQTGTDHRVMTSSDGINWTARQSAAGNTWESVCYGNGLFVAVASSGTGNRVMTSSDGITWTSGSSTADSNWNSVCYGDGKFVAVANTGTGNRVMTSSSI